MNLFKYINSKDIRKHLEEIDYQFNTLEAAYLIYFCRSLTLAERHKAFSLSNAVLKEEHSVFFYSQKCRVLCFREPGICYAVMNRW
jgi:hypothetical protein